MKTLLVLLALVAGCGIGKGPLRPEPRAGDRNTKMVSRVVDFTSELQWQRSGYWRIEDQPTWPWFIVLAGDGTACPVFTHTVYVPLTGAYHACDIAWRVRRLF